MEGVEKLYKKDLRLGNVSIEKFEIDNRQALYFNFSNIGKNLPGLTSGSYVRLIIDSQLVMSDTPMEKVSNTEFVEKAHGDVMIAGLGLGLIIHNLRDKIKSGVVKSITIYEINQNVINLVSPLFKKLPIEYVCKDILSYLPPKEEKYDTIYFDIWPSITPDENLPQIRMLHNRWKFHKKTKSSYMNSWMKEYMQNRKRQENYW